MMKFFSSTLLLLLVVASIIPQVSALEYTKDPIENCKEYWFDQTLDHFNWAPGVNGLTTFQQRYYVCDKHWKKHDDGSKGPIFFYAGNEGAVTGYITHTGLMWENAEEFGALLIFAEHRYYGETQPYSDLSSTMPYIQYLTSEQAMADYVTLIQSLKAKDSLDAEHSPVVVFGGSYGGMLASWLRIKYPETFAGAIAASAPIFMFPLESDEFHTNSYWQVVTHDATEAAGSVAGCADNVRAFWRVLFNLGQTVEGRSLLSSALQLCDDSRLENFEDVLRVAEYHLLAWDTMAMGNYPYPSDYVSSNVGVPMVAWPVRAACSHLGADNGFETDSDTDLRLVAAAARATAVYTNVTGDLECFTVPDDPDDVGIWDFQWCTEMLPQEMPHFTMTGTTDMFWARAFNMTSETERCEAKWGVTPNRQWIKNCYGGRALSGASASNIVFSNGGYDPWSSGGVERDVSPSVVVVDIPEGGHHLDLMFSHPADPESVKRAREIEVAHIRKWVSGTDHC